MPNSPNLAIPLLDAAQNNKYATVNEAIDILDAAVAGTLTKNVAGSTDVTLTTSPDGGEANNAILVFTGALTGNINVILPAITKKWRVVNDTTGAFTLTIKAATGTGVALNTGDEIDVRFDGTNFIKTPNVFPYVCGFSSIGGTVAGVAMLRHPYPLAVTLRAGLPDSQGKADIAATAQTDFDIQKNGSSIGTMRFAASATVATFIFASDVAFAVGDELSVVAPGSADATLAGVRAAIRGDR